MRILIDGNISKINELISKLEDEYEIIRERDEVIYQISRHNYSPTPKLAPMKNLKPRYQRRKW